MIDRIGTINADGSRIWPECTISGQAYTRPAHTLDIGTRSFIVYDPFPSADLPELIEAAVAIVFPKPKRKAHERFEVTDEETPGL